MTWEILFHDEFLPEFLELTTEIQEELLAHTKLLESVGPLLRRPHADTLKGSRHKNMKELRFYADDGVWRIAFAFDPEKKSNITCSW